MVRWFMSWLDESIFIMTGQSTPHPSRTFPQEIARSPGYDQGLWKLVGGFQPIWKILVKMGIFPK